MAARTEPQTRDDEKTRLQARHGELPREPETGFVGRSRELLALQRLLRGDGNVRYAVVRGSAMVSRSPVIPPRGSQYAPSASSPHRDVSGQQIAPPCPLQYR